MTKKLSILALLIIFNSCNTIIIDAKLTVDGFSDIMAPENESFRADFDASHDRIIETMCDGQASKIPTPESILEFIVKIQTYIDKIKDTQNITPETVHIARCAIFDVAKARKMLHHTTPADVQVDIRHAIQKVDMQVLELEKYLQTQEQN